MEIKDILKKYWFVGIVAIGLVVYGVVYCVQSYQNRTIYVDAKESDGKSIVYTLNDENYYADDLYSDLYDSLGQSTAYLKWSQEIIRNAYETTDDISTLANNYYAYISQYNETSTIDSSLKSSGYVNGSADLLDYCLDMVKANKLYKEFYLANYDTYVPKYIETYSPKKVYHILIKVADVTDSTDDDGNSTKVANLTDEEQAKLDEVTEAIKNGGDVKSLAAEYSDDSSNENEGYVGLFNSNTISNYLVSEFADAVKELDYGETTSEPVLSAYGYHFIYVEQPTDDELKADDTFMSEISSFYSYSNVKALSEKADELGITIQNEDLKSLIDEYLTQAEEEINPSTTDESEASE